MTAVPPRVLAFYLPQFHSIPENDRWWGKGFTEWTNVRRAAPLFEGHLQPDEPGELGYYDLRSEATREAQADLARAHGVAGFCYYHYWFNGRRLLGHVLDEVLQQGKPDFPFCLCWANESWTRTWDGHERNVLMRQSYGPDDDRQHLRWLARVFEDPRYIRVGRRPLLLVYRASRLPNALWLASVWREEAERLGLEGPYLCSVESFAEDRLVPSRIGFDAAVEFQPDWVRLAGVRSTAAGAARVFDYKDLVQAMVEKPPAPYLRFPCVTPGWDNSPRRPNAIVLHGSTPALYERWLETSIARMVVPSADENLVFVNAWNEWGEGAHLEPGARWGRAYLEATRDVAARSSVQVWTPTVTVSSSRVPRVTVAVPTCNGAPYVEAAVKSILAQTFTDLELLVVDDCSDDGTIERVSRIADPRIRLERNAVRLGLARNWNRCLEAAAGEYVCVFHQDDLMAADNLARKVALLDEHPAVGFVHSNVRQIGPSGDVLSTHWYSPPSPADEGVHSGRQVLDRLFWGQNLICCPSVVVRRAAVMPLGGFDTRLPFTADWEMWMRIALFHDVAYLSQSLVDYRRHSTAETERFLGPAGLAQAFMAKSLFAGRFAQQLPDDWPRRLAEQSLEEAVVGARDALAGGKVDDARAYVTLVAALRARCAEAPDRESLDWTADLLRRLLEEGFSVPLSPSVVDGASGQEELLRQRCRELEQEVASLRASGSWKLTAPVRMLFRLLTGRP